ncbi:hypothetical protein AALD01_12575 [Oscillospiraceae bacterium 21-37]
MAWLMASAAELDLAQPDLLQTLLPWNSPVLCKT